MSKMSADELNLTYILEYRRLIAGVIALFVFLLYPVIAVYPKFFLSKNIVLSYVPLIISYTVYYIWCYTNNIDINTHFESIKEIIAPENRDIFILRSAMLASFFATYSIALSSFDKITKLYQKYISGTYANSSYNIKWLKNYVLSLKIIGFVFFIVAIFTNTFTAWLYVIGAIVNFMILIDNAIRYKPFERSKEYEVKWNFRNGWHVCNNDIEVDTDSPTVSIDPIKDNEEELFQRFEKWIREEKAYCQDNFSIKDVTKQFPELEYHTMNRLLSNIGYTFQSYVRKVRIEKAIEIMNEKENTYPLKQIAYMVGFAHVSSFSRAFLAEKGCNPSEFREHLK